MNPIVSSLAAGQTINAWPDIFLQTHPREWVIRLDKNLYGLKDAGLSLFEILLFYMDYYLMFSPSEDKIDEFYASFQAYINI